MSKKITILEHLDAVAKVFPAPMYWEDINNVILGANEPVLKASGALVREAFVGKTAFDLYPKEIAINITEHNEKVMETGEILSQEEMIVDVSTGEVKYFMAVKAPLHDDEGSIIGLVGTSVDISAEKEAERLKIENEKQKQSLKEQEKFTKIAEQVAHDIRSPLASLLMIIKSCTEIPEAERIALREAAISIGDITSNLLSRYIKKKPDLVEELEESQPMLASATLLQLLADKKYEYQNLSIKLNHDISQTGHFAFIKISISDFKRMISNLINNAKDAFNLPGSKKDKITINLDASNEWVTVSIQDNGKGMAPELIKKIKRNISITEGKKEGYGIGLTQVRETLQRYQGEFSIASELGQGTKVTLTFPRIKAPSWIGEEIKLGKQDTIVILDDDNSIHTAWDAHFESVLKSSPDIKIKHFHHGEETLDYLESLTSEEKAKIFLLTDFELLKQELNGLNVIEKSGVARSLLVTSHYTNLTVRDKAARTNSKILPKQLASEILITIDEKIKYENIDESIDFIIVDDDERFTDDLINFVFSDKKISCFNDPRNFLANVSKFPKDTKILLDNHFSTGNVKGIELAKILHAQGYLRLYLLSGNSFEQGDLPNYLTAIRKDDLASLTKIK